MVTLDTERESGKFTEHGDEDRMKHGCVSRYHLDVHVRWTRAEVGATAIHLDLASKTWINLCALDTATYIPYQNSQRSLISNEQKITAVSTSTRTALPTHFVPSVQATRA